MSDMSLKQAKEIAERLEMAELGLKSLLTHIEQSTKLFEDTLNHQKQIILSKPIMDNKLNMMKILVGVNIGFVFGLVVAKYFL
jgi:hypothetical protein